jgi:enoyl-CoA hydratase/carnithine racemase
MADAAVLYEASGPVVRVTFNRPHVLNAGDRRFTEDLHAAVERVAAAPDVRVAVFTGRGRAFSTGVDLGAMARGELGYEDLVRWETAMTRMERLDCVTVAAINGHCIGGGVQMAIVCDYRLASDAALLGLPAVDEGLVPSMAPYRLPRLIGTGPAKDLVLTGTPITAARAEAIGLVSRVVPAAEFARALDETVARFAAAPPGSTRAAKRLLAAAWDLPFERFREAMERELRALCASDEHRAAVTAYVDARRARAAVPPATGRATGGADPAGGP